MEQLRNANFDRKLSREHPNLHKCHQLEQKIPDQHRQELGRAMSRIASTVALRQYFPSATTQLASELFPYCRKTAVAADSQTATAYDHKQMHRGIQHSTLFRF